MQKIYRLSSNSSFNYIYKKGQSASCKHFTLLYTPTKFMLKVGFSISKKVGKAHIRNKTKRRLKEGFRLLIPCVNQHYNYIIVARPAAATATYRELYASLIYTLNKVGMITDIAGANASLQAIRLPNETATEPSEKREALGEKQAAKSEKREALGEKQAAKSEKHVAQGKKQAAKSGTVAK